MLIIGCETPPSDPNEISKLSVLAFFTSDTTRQNIYLYNTALLEDTNSIYYEDYFYEKADVLVLNNEGEIIPFYYKKAPAEYLSSYINTNEINFIPGEKYMLKIESEYGTIEGETVFPGDFQIKSPAEGIFYVSEDSHKNQSYIVDLKIQWTKSKNAYAYIINYKRPYLGPIWTYYVNHSFISYDTVYNLSVYELSPGEDTTKCSKIIITAIDKNYYLHHFKEYNISGIKGGYGYFGSGTVRSINIKFTKRN